MFEKIFIKLLAIQAVHATTIIPDPNNQSTRITQELPGSRLIDTLGILKTNLLGLTFQILTGIAIIMVLVSGYRYITSAGDPEKAKKARGALIQVLAGLALFILTYAVVNLIVGIVQGAGNEITIGSLFSGLIPHF